MRTKKLGRLAPRLLFGPGVQKIGDGVVEGIDGQPAPNAVLQPVHVGQQAIGFAGPGGFSAQSLQRPRQACQALLVAPVGFGPVDDHLVLALGQLRAQLL